MTERATYRRRVILSSAIVGLANVWAIVLTLVALPLLLDAFGLARFGAWALLMTFSATNGWLSLLDLGLGTAATRTVASHAGRDDAAGVARGAATTLLMFVLLGTAAGIAIVLLGRLVGASVLGIDGALAREFEAALVPFGAWVFADFAFGGAVAVLDGLQRIDLSRFADMGRRLLVLGTGVLAARSTGDLEATTAAAAIAAGIAAALTLGVVVLRLDRSTMRPSSSELAHMLRYGVRVAALRPLGVVHRTMDRIVVGIVLGPSAVALVEIAAQLQAGADAVLSASSYAVVPSSAFLEADHRRDALRELLLTGTRYSLLVTAPVVVGTCLLAGPMVDVWMGRDQAEAAGLAAVAVASIGLAAPLQVGSNLLLGVGRAASIFRAVAASVALNLVFTIGLVPVIGIVGAFWSTIVATLVLHPLLGRSMLRQVDVDLRTFLRAAVAPVVAPAVVLGVVVAGVLAVGMSSEATLVAGTVGGATAYLAAAVRRSFGPTELQALYRTILSR